MIVPNCSKEELIPIIQGKILEGLTIKAYDGRVLNSYNHLARTNLLAGNCISMALNASGATPNGASQN